MTPAFLVHGPTAPEQTLVLDSPHSGHQMPADFGSVCTAAALRDGEDCFIDALWLPAAARGVPLLAAQFPRTYLDVNRHAADIDPELLAEPWPEPLVPSGKARIGKSLIWRTLDDGRPIYQRKLGLDEVRRRIEHFHQPYHQTLKSLLDAVHARFGVVHHINCHSMNPVSGAMGEGGAGRQRADIVLGDRDGTTCAPAFTAFVRDFLAGCGYRVALNDPFKGVELVRAFAAPAAGRHSLQLEVNKRLYVDLATLQRHAGFDPLQAHLMQLVEAIQRQFRPTSSTRTLASPNHHTNMSPVTSESRPPIELPVELKAPDIQPWKAGNTGVDWVHVYESGRPGPKVMVQALTHGNEICGAIALDWLMQQITQHNFRPACGTLTLAWANVEAYARFDPANPFPSRCVDEDLNRVWADSELLGPRDSVELRRARQLRPFVDAAELLLDIHSMSGPCRPLMVCGTVDKNADYARQLGVPGDLLIDTGHPAGLRMVERGGYGDPASPKRALLIECGQHWEAAAAEVAIDTLVRFLGLTGLADAAWVQAHARVPLPSEQRLVRVTEAVVARSSEFRFLVPAEGFGVVPQAGTPIAQDGEHIWTAPYDNTVLVMPGVKNLKAGGTAVRLGRFE